MTSGPPPPPPLKWGTRHYEPAGLEVVGLQPGLEYYEAPSQEKFVSDTATPYGLPKYGGPGQEPARRGCLPRTRRQWMVWLIVGMVLVAIVVGGAVGGVLVSRNLSSRKGRGGSSPATSTASPTPTPSSAPTITPPKSIRLNSPLAVTAYRKINGVEMYLFFHGPDSVVYRTTYDSATGPSTANTSSLWQPAVAATTQAAPNSPLCVTPIVYDQTISPQLQVYHLSQQNQLTGTNFNDQRTPKVVVDAIGSYANLTAHPSSRVACYWPYVVFQGADEQFVGLRLGIDESEDFGPVLGTSVHNLSVLGTQGSHMAVVPLSTLFSTTAEKGGYGVIGQDDGGDLVAFIPDEETTANVTRSWSGGIDFPLINLPQGASFAAFATGRQNDSNNRTNTYVLYQTADSKISVTWRDDEVSGWKTAQPAALADADEGTDIACVTMPESMRTAQGGVLLLEAASAETRCYFQRGGTVIEVRLDADGEGWSELGSVPLP